MVSPVSGASAAYLSQTSSAQSNQAPKTSTPSSQPQDSVQLSAAAKAAASGDVDHDGDSH